MSVTFPGFRSARQLVPFLQQQPDLLGFVQQFFVEMKQLVPGREEPNVTRDQKILDTFSRLLVGDEVCTAIAISGPNILVATNAAIHDNDRWSFQMRGSVTAARNWYELKVSCRVVSDRSRGITKFNTYRFRPRGFQLEPLDGTTCRFEFRPETHQIPSTDQPIILTASFNEQMRDWALVMHIISQQEEFTLQPEPIFNMTNPLSRRTNELFQRLSLIAHDTLYNCEEHDLIQSNHRWDFFLHYSLTFELSRTVYRNHINPDDMSGASMNPVLEFYKRLVENYQLFKSQKGYITSISSMKRWLFRLRSTDTLQRLNAPGYIQNNPEKFLIMLRQYLIDLINAESFIRTDALARGVLSQTLMRENIFKKDVNFRIIDGRQGIHAEMRLFDQHVRSSYPMSDYYGITKLCCALCTYTLKRFGANGFRVDTRGSHAGLYPGWELSNGLRQNLPTFLGPHLHALYQNLQGRVCSVPGMRRADKQDLAELALRIIPMLGVLNTPTIFSKLGIDPALIFEMPDDTMPSQVDEAL